MKMPTEGKARAAYSSRDFQSGFGVGNTKMHEEINAGRLKAHYLGRKLLIYHDDAVAWLQSLPSRPTSREAA